MLYTPVNGFTATISNYGSDRPGVYLGSAVATAQNAYTYFTEILSATAFDCFGILIRFCGIASNNTARDVLIKIGIDHAGGSTYTDNTISGLLASCATSAIAMLPTWYYFPLYIPAGSTIAGTGARNNASAISPYVGVTLFGKPTRPELVRAGKYVDTFGETIASSCGITVTSGEGSEGSWTEMTGGTPTTRPYWWWQAGMGCNDSTMTSLMYHLDVSAGDASNKDVIFENQLYLTNAVETMSNVLLADTAYQREVGSGQKIYTRLQCSGTPDDNLSTIVYALGG